MNVEAIVTAVVTAAATGGIVAYVAKGIFERAVGSAFSLREARQNIVWQNEIEYRKAQLEELYGPLYSMLKTGSKLYRLWMDKKIVEVNFDVKQYFANINDDIRKLIVQKMHLVDGAVIPPQFIDYMTTAMIWNWYCAKTENASYPSHVEQLQEAKWPEHFEHYVYSTTEQLKQRLDELYRKNRIE